MKSRRHKYKISDYTCERREHLRDKYVSTATARIRAQKNARLIFQCPPNMPTPS